MFGVVYVVFFKKVIKGVTYYTCITLWWVILELVWVILI
jgi:hypothetical protein